MQQYLYYIPMMSILASTTLRDVFTIGTLDLTLFGSYAIKITEEQHWTGPKNFWNHRKTHHKPLQL